MTMTDCNRVWRVIVLAFSLALAACGGGDPSEDIAAKADVSTFKGNGIWWNPSEGGSGFFFEAQGGTGVVTFYSYEASGRPVWYMASGPFTGSADGKFQFSGMLQRYSDGQPGASSTPKTPASTLAGTTTIVFYGETAQVQVPGRTYNAERFNRSGQFVTGSGVQPATGTQPETGIFWNPDQGGRGYAIEVANGVATVAVFQYADDGQPIWNLVVVPMPKAGQGAKGMFTGYSGGQTLSGAYKAPTSSDQGTFSVLFGEPCNGKVVFPNMPPVAVKRFAFGSLPAGAECRTPKGSAPAVSDFKDVQLTLVSPTSLRSDTTTGAKLPSSFQFSVSGNVAALNGRTVYAVVEDPENFYPTDPRVTLTAATGVVMSLTASPLKRIGRYIGEIRVFLCLDSNCNVQFAGSPFVVPYDFTVAQATPAPAVPVPPAPDLTVEPGDACPASMATSLTFAPEKPFNTGVQTANAFFWFRPGFNLEPKGLKMCLAERGQAGFADLPAGIKALAQPGEDHFVRIGAAGPIDQALYFYLKVYEQGPVGAPDTLLLSNKAVAYLPVAGKWTRTVLNVVGEYAAATGRVGKHVPISTGRMAHGQMYVSTLKSTELGASWDTFD